MSESEKKSEFENYIKDQEHWNRNQYIPGAYANAHSWSKSPWFNQVGWRGKLIKYSALLSLTGITIAIIYNIVDLI